MQQFIFFVRHAICCHCQQMVYLYICWSAARWDRFAHLGLCLLRRLQGLLVYDKLQVLLINKNLQIVFRAALTLLLANKNAILACDDIAALANLIRDSMVTNEIVTNCHSFIEAMFKLRLKRSELEALRKICVGRDNT